MNTISPLSDTCPPEAIAVRIVIPPLCAGGGIQRIAILGGDAACAWAAMLGKCINAALAAKEIRARPPLDPMAIEDAGEGASGFHLGNEGLSLFYVRGWRQGLAVIRDELEDLHLLPYSHIVYMDADEEIWRCYHGREFDPSEALKKMSRP